MQTLFGSPDIQDTLRPTKGGKKTSHVLERNIRILQEEGKNLVIGIRATITPTNIYRQFEMLDYFERLGIKAVFSDPVFPPVEKNHRNVHKAITSNDYNVEYAKEFLKARRIAEAKGIFYGSIFTVNFDEETEIFCRSCLPSPHLTTDGYVSCCDMSFLGDILPELVYGKYSPDRGLIEYDQKKIVSIRTRKASNLADCKGCEILYHCAGVCFGEGLNETGNLLGVKKDYCEAIKYLAKNLETNKGRYPYFHP
jgi:radical SAM protein with 4Fe4S-binding SPASM domain